MTRYLITRGYVNPPYLEIYECYGPSPAPVLVPFLPPFAGQVELTRFNKDQDMMAAVTRFRRDQMEGLGAADDPTAPANVVWFSPDDKFVLTANPIRLYSRAGPYYVPVEAPDFPLITGVASSASLSEDGNVIVLTRVGFDNTIEIYDRNEGTLTWTQKDADLFDGDYSGNPLPALTLSDDSEYLFLPAKPGTTGALGPKSVYRLVGGDYTPIGPVGSERIIALVNLPGTEVWRLAYQTTDTRAQINIYDLDAGVLTPVGSIPGTALAGASNPSGLFSPDGLSFWHLAVRSTFDADAAQWLRGFYYPGSNTVWTAVAGIPTLTAGFRVVDPMPLAISRQGDLLAAEFRVTDGIAITQNEVFLLELTEAAGVYSAATRHHRTIPEPPNLGIWAVTGFSPDGSIAHFAYNHMKTTSPFDVNDPLPMAEGVSPGAVQQVIYSRSGRVSFAVNSTGTLAWAVQDGAGDYLDFATLEGTFVSLFNRAPGSGAGAPFTERTFVQHILDSKITDIVFSPDSDVLTYHVSNDDTPTSGLGRFVYDITPRDADEIKLRAVLSLPDDERSFAAFNASTSYMAITFRNPVFGNNIRLYQLDSEYVPTEKDVEMVSFGPVAYSNCETVAVSHGGVQPYTLYDHTTLPTDELVLRPLPDIDWSTESQVIAAIFTSDCAGLVIVTPDDIVVINPDTGETEDDTGGEGPGDGTQDDPPLVTEDPDTGDVIITGPEMPPGDPGVPSIPDTWVVDDDDKSVSNIIYIPYVAIHVTYKTR